MFRDNWLQYGFGDELLEFSKTAPFVIDYRRASPHPVLSDPLEVAADSARHIYDNHGPIVLMVSGGIDSQAMAYAFKQANIPFTCRFYRYNGGLNDHDFKTAHFYDENDIAVEVHDIDLIDFHENKLTEWAAQYGVNSPHFLSHLYLASTVTEGTPIFSGCIVRNGIGELPWSAFAFERYSRIANKKVIGYFFSYCPHLVYANLRYPLHGTDSYSIKVNAYQDLGYPVVPQERKLHGFENIKNYFDKVTIDSKTKRLYGPKLSNRPYDLMFRYPLERKITYSHQCVTKLPN